MPDRFLLLEKNKFYSTVPSDSLPPMSKPLYEKPYSFEDYPDTPPAVCGYLRRDEYPNDGQHLVRVREMDVRLSRLRLVLVEAGVFHNISTNV